MSITRPELQAYLIELQGDIQIKETEIRDSRARISYLQTLAVEVVECLDELDRKEADRA